MRRPTSSLGWGLRLTNCMGLWRTRTLDEISKDEDGKSLIFCIIANEAKQSPPFLR